MDKDAKIYVAGHTGMVGSAIVRKLKKMGYTNIIGKRSHDLDLTRQQEVEDFFSLEKPSHVFLAAAKVGGILANSRFPADFSYENLSIAINVVHSAYKAGVRRLLFLGSSCIYPKMAPQPLKEEYLLSGYLEETNEPYAIAKIAGLKLCEYYNKQLGTQFISAMPTNLYGSNDNYHKENSHVIPALIRRFHEAKKGGERSVTIWGSGTPRREFLHVDDLADACVFLMNNYYENQTVNIGWGKDISIREVAELIANIVGFSGVIENDLTKPDGTPVKLLDVSFINAMGWSPRISLQDGLLKTYEDFLREIK